MKSDPVNSWRMYYSCSCGVAESASTRELYLALALKSVVGRASCDPRRTAWKYGGADVVSIVLPMVHRERI